MSFIFEDQDVRNTVAVNEAIVEIASTALINANVVLEDYIYSNLVQFTSGTSSLADIYENIRNFVISENVSLYNQYSEILSDNELSPQQKAACFYENSDLPGSSIDNPIVNADLNSAMQDPSFMNKIRAMGSNTMNDIANHSRRAADYMKAQGNDAIDYMRTRGQSAIDHARIQSQDAIDHMRTQGQDAIDYMRTHGQDAIGRMKTHGREAAEFMQNKAHEAAQYAQDNPYTAAGIGAAGLGITGLGAYGAYKAFKNRKQH